MPQVRFDAEVLGGDLANGLWTLRTTAGELVARTVVNCAGLFGDVVEQRLLGGAEMAIHPRKGQFVVFDKPAARLLRTTILPVPSERTKGVVLARTVFGNLLVGPTAEEQEDRERATVEQATLEQLIARAVEMVPALAGMPVTATYAGLRPATERKEYRVRHQPERQLADGRRHPLDRPHRRPGPGQARGSSFSASSMDEAADPTWPRMPNLAEHCERDWAVPGHGGIVCHCELVSRREIEAALSGPLPARDLGGLKRRTRAGMGRCQGFYCGAELAALTAGHFAEPLAVGVMAEPERPTSSSSVGGPPGSPRRSSCGGAASGGCSCWSASPRPAACRAIAAIRRSGCASSAGC